MIVFPFPRQASRHLVVNILGEIVLLDPAHITAVPKHFTLLSLAHKKYKPVFI